MNRPLESSSASRTSAEEAAIPWRERPRGPLPAARALLRWIYLARVGLAGGIFGAAVVAWRAAPWEATLIASLLLVTTIAVTVASYAFTHVSGREPGVNFLYGEAVYDVLLVTAVVHLTGGADSGLAPLYILLISAYALLLPFRGGLLAAGLTSIAYTADLVWAYAASLSGVLVLQLGVFASVALAAGFIAARLREAGRELSTVEGELAQLRLDTGDILRNIHTAVLTVDGFGNLTYANPAAEELLELDAEAWLGRPVLDELGRRAPALRNLVARTAALGLPAASEEVQVDRRGDAVPVGVSTAILERGDEPPAVTAIMRDISDRKRVEELHRRAERLEAVAELSASLAHEIKNPLASIRSSVEQLARGLAAAHRRGDADDALLTELILRESDRLSRLLTEFIDFARLQVVRREVVDLRDVVREAVEVVRRHPSYRDGVDVRCVFSAQPVCVRGDPDLLHRVAFNLVLNAVQAAEEVRRPIRIQVEVAVAGGVPGAGDAALLRVSDDGPGIPKSDLPRIFDPFFSGRGGTGLGLAIVHRAVEAHGGTVFVDSDPRIGTRFTLYFPRLREEAAAMNTASETAS